MNGPFAWPAAKRGFALLAVLWVIVTSSVIAMGAQLIVRAAVERSQHRMRFTRAMWNAEDCLERARSEIDRSLAAYQASEVRVDPWLTLDSVLTTSTVSISESCAVSVVPSGTVIDVNEASGRQVRALLLALGVGSVAADSLTDALLDWRDADDVARLHGVEGAWYEQQGLRIRNGPLASMRELAHVRGFEPLGGVDSVIGVESGRVSLRHASLTVLGSLPGFSGELLAHIAELRSRRANASELDVLAASVAGPARDTLLAHYSELIQLTTRVPEFWTLTATGRDGEHDTAVMIEIRLVRGIGRAAVVRRRDRS